MAICIDDLKTVAKVPLNHFFMILFIMFLEQKMVGFLEIIVKKIKNGRLYVLFAW